jgi:nucleotide-binding universal stress UspA family protein
VATRKHAGTYLAATDGSAPSDKAVDFAIARAKEAGAKLLIVTAVEATLMGAPSTAGGPDADLPAQMKRQAWAVVRAGKGRARAAGVKATGEVIDVYPPTDVAAAIVKHAEQVGAAQIFVGSHGRTGIVRQMLGSVADKVTRLAHCHVTVVR